MTSLMLNRVGVADVRRGVRVEKIIFKDVYDPRKVLCGYFDRRAETMNSSLKIVAK